MKLLQYSVCIFLICFAHTSLQAQEQQQSIEEGSINDQFEFVIKKSSDWRDDKGQTYEVIKRNLMLTLKAHTLDSLNAIQAKLDETNKMVITQQKEINTLKTDLAKTQETLAAIEKEKDSMVLFGIPMSKSNYSLVLWSIITALLVSLIFFIYQFKSSHFITKAAKSDLAEIENEFAAYRRSALEREQKVKRQLQDELNKYAS